jgi:hypothetical protein
MAAIMKPASADSPIAEAYLHPASAQSLRELLARKPLSVGDVARSIGVPVETMRNAIDGTCPLEVSVWRAVATTLNADHAQFNITTDERDGTPCLELYCVWT